jgi:ABC-2 type transport system ATP-binding protein
MIAVERLTKRFGPTVAVDGVSFAVRAGEVFGLLGPDGAGKTTLLRMLSTVLQPDRGTARVAGAELPAEAERVKAAIGYMPQAFSLYGDLTVRENLRFVADVFGVPPPEIEARTRRLLAFSRLERFQDRLADHLSGGMRQKLALAATLMHEPDILVLDEPTTGVDPVSRREFWQILDALNRQGGKTVVVATPYMDEAERCGRVALMHGGRLLSVSAPAAVRAQMPGIVLEVTAAPRRAALVAARGLPGVIRANLFGTAIHLVVDGPDAVPRVREGLTAHGIAVDEVRRIEPSLEDVFVALLTGTHG